MSLDTIRSAIVAKLEAVSGIGLVHGYERYARKQSDFRAFYEDGDKVLGWFIRRRATRETEETNLRNTVVHTWDIRGYMSLQDAEATELAFDLLIESVRAAFRDDITIGGAVDTTVIDGKVGLQLEDSGPVMFSGILCHGARLSLMTENGVDIGDLAAADFNAFHADWDVPPHGDVAAPLPAADSDAEDLIQPEQDP